MRNFNNLLYVSHGITNETEGLQQALSLARKNDAPLTVLVACPEFPKELPDFKRKYEESLLEQAKESVRSARQALTLADETVAVAVELACDNKPAILITQHVLRGGYDLLIKEAEVHERAGGFRALDMTLLRKCPCPVWLHRPTKRSRKDINFAVAIDPEGDESAQRALSKRMLQLGGSLADSAGGHLHIVSCWDYPFEEFLRHNLWAKTDENIILETVRHTEVVHRSALEQLIGESKLSGPRSIHHLRGNPEQLIPLFVNDEGIDLLVMGTVARTGIAGLTMGNTAENILQKLTCSLLALKPQGFVSPVKAFS